MEPKQRNVCAIIALVFVLLGSLNWLLVGLFQLDLVALIFGSMSVVSRILYAVIGTIGTIGAIWMIVYLAQTFRTRDSHTSGFDGK